MAMKINGYAVKSAEDKFALWQFERRDVGPKDVAFENLYAGICHSDIHQARNEWKDSNYPMVPGHENVGRVVKVGSEVTKVKVGDLVGVGCLVDSCRKCKECKEDTENQCANGSSGTYNSFEQDKKTPTYGGYSPYMVVTDHFVLKIDDRLKSNLPGVAPLLCAGITTYAPLMRYKDHVKSGKKVGVVGLGGLGHMAVKFAVAFGADVTVFSTSSSKEADSKKLGAKNFVINKDEKAMKECFRQYDLILDTVSAEHDYQPYIDALVPNGILVLVGVPDKKTYKIEISPLVYKQKTVAGSLIGGLKETQEMLDYCAEKGIFCDVELITVPDTTLETAYNRTMKSDVKYRFVIDIKKTFK